MRKLEASGDDLLESKYIDQRGKVTDELKRL